ncbi:hypothetical protein KKF91_17645 [Myxococcota bacterium]|nr:hypothetical protein [Myxococcota bacterium]
MITLLALISVLGDINVAGSVYLNQPTLFSKDRRALPSTVLGMNAETSVKMVAEASDTVSAHVKLCHGCHGIEADMAYLDWAPTETFGVRAGRLPVPFGEFYLRYDPANHASTTKPLPYAMGRMLRRDDYNLALLPEPYPDQGLEVYGLLRGDFAELTYHLYAVAGLKGSAGDLDFIRSRNEYWADNNRTPVVGGRLSLAFPTLPFKLWRWLSIGASGLHGTYDDEDELSWTMGGVDLYARFGRVNLRGEALFRRTEIPDTPARYRQQLVDLFTQREGFYAQLDGPAVSGLDWLIRLDGIRRAGPVPLGNTYSPKSEILRYTGGLNYSPAERIKLKLNYEYWTFNDYGDEHILHTGLVGTF